MNTRFEDRTDAGERLASVLTQFRERPDAIVLGLARGGIPVAAAAAKAAGTYSYDGEPVEAPDVITADATDAAPADD